MNPPENPEDPENPDPSNPMDPANPENAYHERFWSRLAQLTPERVQITLPDKPEWTDAQIAKGRSLVRTEQVHRWVAVVLNGTARVQQDGSCRSGKFVSCTSGGRATLAKEDTRVSRSSARMLCVRVIDQNWIEICL